MPGRILAKEWGTLKVLPKPGFAPEIRVDGIPYDLAQFHFHTPSEHTVDGRRTEMEVHFVHLIRDGQGCASSNRPLLVIGVFIDAAGNSDRELQRIFPPDLPKSTAGPKVEVFSVDLRALVPPGGPAWRYEGGLTAPAKDCATFAPLSDQAVTGDFPEAVHWYIYDQKMHLPRSFIDRFSALFPEGNARLLKARGGRAIYSLQNGNQ